MTKRFLKDDGGVPGPDGWREVAGLEALVTSQCSRVEHLRRLEFQENAPAKLE